MDTESFSKSVTNHLQDVAKGTKLEDKIGKDKRAKVTTGAVLAAAAKPGAAILWPSNNHDFVEIDDSLFFFFKPATIVRWPKPVDGELKNFAVRIETAGQEGSGQTDAQLQLDSKNIEGFDGRFRIESTTVIKANGTREKLVTLVIIPSGHPEEGIDLIVLGNPGGELGSNTSCKG